MGAAPARASLSAYLAGAASNLSLQLTAQK
jgi:hypothetical protein